MLTLIIKDVLENCILPMSNGHFFSGLATHVIEEIFIVCSVCYSLSILNSHRVFHDLLKNCYS